METDGWDFSTNSAGSNAMSSIDTIGSADGSGHMECSFNGGDQVSLPSTDSLMQENGVASVQGGLLGFDIQDLVGARHTKPTMHFSSNHLLVAAKWFHQKRLQRALASSGTHTLSVAHSYADDHPRPPSHGTQDGVKLSLRRMWEGAAGTTNESLAVTTNGSKTLSPQQVSSECLSSPSIWNSPYFSCFLCPREQAEQHGLFSQARREFHDGMLNSVNGASIQANQLPDALWHSHPQVSHGVLSSFPTHNGFNQSTNPCERGVRKSKSRVRARRGQATDPHSIAERLRRERIADRMKLLQELVPNTNKTDQAIMLDEIIEYIKFLLLQVKLLSMSRLGNAALILPIASSVPEMESIHTPADGQEGPMGPSQESMSAIEEHVTRLITRNIGAALQFLQRKGLCLVPISFIEPTKSGGDANLSSAPSQQACSLSHTSSSTITVLAK